MTNQATILKRFRKTYGLTQLEIAEHLGLKNLQYISNMERGKCGIPAVYVGLLVKLSRNKKKHWIYEFKRAFLKDQGDGWTRGMRGE